MKDKRWVFKDKTVVSCTKDNDVPANVVSSTIASISKDIFEEYVPLSLHIHPTLIVKEVKFQKESKF